MPRIVYEKLLYEIVGLCFKVHAELGRFAREKQYSDAFEVLLEKNDIPYKREVEIKKLIDNSPAGNRPDFLIENKLIIDFKAKPFITKDDYYQMQRYLNAANMELGLIINFRAYKLYPKRVLNSNYSDDLKNGFND